MIRHRETPTNGICPTDQEDSITSISSVGRTAILAFLLVSSSFCGHSEGLYFSWTDLNEIHGDHLRARQHVDMSIPAGSITPDQIVQTVQSKIGVTRIEKIYIVEVLGEYFYAVEHVNDEKPSTVLVSVKDGSVRTEVSSAEAGRIAQQALANPSEPAELTYLTADNVSKHHEYREKPLPAWAVTLGNNVSVYLLLRKPVKSELSGRTTGELSTSFGCSTRWISRVGIT